MWQSFSAPRKIAALGLGFAAACGLASCDTSYGCTANQECIGALGDLHICKRAPGSTVGTCAALKSEDCQAVFGDWQRDDALLFGAVLPTTGPDQSTGLACQNAIQLAVEDFHQFGPDLPPLPGVAGARRRPLAFVGCSDQSDKLIGERAARHLTEDVGVQAIIGPQWSGVTQQIATNVTVARDVLLISPSATARSITDLDDKGLVWRTSPPDNFQAAAMVLYIAELEAKIRAERSLPPTAKIKLALIYQGTTYGLGFVDSLSQALRINGDSAFGETNRPSFMTNNYGDPSDAQLPVRAELAVDAALAFAPDIIINLCTNEGVTQLLQPVEEQWNARNPGTPGPHWVLGDGGKIPELWTFINDNDGLRRRTTGTVPGSTSALFNGFVSKYEGRGFADGTSPAALGPAGSYDSVYLIAYAAVALGGQPLTGPNLAGSLGALVPQDGAVRVDVGTNNINSTFNHLATGGKIDFVGASGPLDFDTSIGEAPSDIQIWCIPKNAANKADSAQSSGRYLDATTMELRGSIDPRCR